MNLLIQGERVSLFTESNNLTSETGSFNSKREEKYAMKVLLRLVILPKRKVNLIESSIISQSKNAISRPPILSPCKAVAALSAFSIPPSIVGNQKSCKNNYKNYSFQCGIGTKNSQSLSRIMHFI